MKRKLLTSFALLLSLSTYALGGEITVSGAASLKGVLEELIDKFQLAKKNEDIHINLNLGGSGNLKNQIINGAPVDIVFFASQKDLKELDNKNLVEKTYQKDALKNLLVVAGRTNITSLDDIVGYSLSIGVPETVPAGRYAKETLEKFGIWDKVADDIVFAKDVRSAAQYVDLYEVDYAFIYKTDAEVLKNSEIVFTVPENLYSPIIYSYGIIKDKANEDVVKFYDFLNSDTAKKVYKKYGFEVIE